MNKSILFGRLVKDPDIRYTQTQSGELAIANFRIAVNRKYAKENGPNADLYLWTLHRWVGAYQPGRGNRVLKKLCRV